MVWPPVVIPAPAISAEPIMSPTRPVTLEEKGAIATAVSDQFRDPESTHFRWMPLISITGLYCGLVNAKNGFGGYVGYRPFRAKVRHDGDGVITIVFAEVAPSAALAAATVEGCASAGLDLSTAVADDRKR